MNKEYIVIKRYINNHEVPVFVWGENKTEALYKTIQDELSNPYEADLRSVKIMDITNGVKIIELWCIIHK